MHRRWWPPRIPRPFPVTHEPTESASISKPFLVPADTIGGEICELSDAEVGVLNARMHPLQHVVAVASALASVPKFPVDVIDQILEYADLLVTFESETSQEIRGGGDQNELYLELRLPDPSELVLPFGVSLEPRCRELVAECRSHDQGWASQDNEFDGTYKASFTWSEVAVSKNTSATNGETPTEAARTELCTNVRVQREYRHHVKRYVDPNGFVSNIDLGDTVQLILRSQYPGWSNTANFGRLRAKFALSINEDARLLA